MSYKLPFYLSQKMRYSLVLFLIGWLTTQATGQTLTPDSSFRQLARNQAVRAYEQDLREQAHVYEGNEYIAHDHRIKIHPFFGVDSLLSCTIIYRGVQYSDIKMLYDVVRDQLAIQPPGGGFRLRPRNDYIASFIIGGHPFMRIVGDSAAGVPTGFYEILHNGRLKALARRVKVVHEDISSGKYQAEYLVKDRFFILKEGVYYEVKSKRSLLNVFPEQAKLLRKFMRSNGLKFNDEKREEAISQVTNRYEDLLK
ncbi:hypothetical protein Slin_1228 [Spirosoma linguale DSM 74]|uniref:Uncharacterized protein n=2 Tax=Spirosoma TaxID=107 RepID=D2QL39_SPILD|nr:hypothetical protein Slin_1228 [Spirosoma linguale DSM 74]